MRSPLIPIAFDAFGIELHRLPHSAIASSLRSARQASKWPPDQFAERGGIGGRRPRGLAFTSLLRRRDGLGRLRATRLAPANSTMTIRANWQDGELPTTRPSPSVSPEVRRSGDRRSRVPAPHPPCAPGGCRRSPAGLHFLITSGASLMIPSSIPAASVTWPVCRRRLASSLRTVRSVGRIVVARSR